MLYGDVQDSVYNWNESPQHFSVITYQNKYQYLLYEWTPTINSLLGTFDHKLYWVQHYIFILCMHPVNERRRYIVTSSLIGWEHTQNDPCIFVQVSSIKYRADSRLVPSQWETSLQSNAVSHWLSANLQSALNYHLQGVRVNSLDELFGKFKNAEEWMSLKQEHTQSENIQVSMNISRPR